MLALYVLAGALALLVAVKTLALLLRPRNTLSVSSQWLQEHVRDRQ